MKNRTLIVFSVILLFALSLSTPVNRLLNALGVVSVTKIGNEIQAQTQGEDGSHPILDAIERIKAWIADTYTNYFPGYNEIVMLMGEADYAMAEPIDRLFASEKELTSPLEPEPAAEEEKVPESLYVSVKSRFLNDTGTHRNYLITATRSDGYEEQTLERVTAYTEDELKELMEPRLSEMKTLVRLLSKYTNVVVYAGSRFQDSPVIEDVIEGAYSTEGDLDEFLGELEPYAKIGRLQLETLDDRFQKMFVTDHHWNLVGSQEGYEDILELLREFHPDIGEPVRGTEQRVLGLRLYGSFARLSNYYRLYDHFSFYDYDLPEHKVLGGPTFRECADKYLNGGYDSSRGVSHYDVFYPFYSRSRSRLILTKQSCAARWTRAIFSSAWF